MSGDNYNFFNSQMPFLITAAMPPTGPQEIAHMMGYALNLMARDCMMAALSNVKFSHD